MHLDQLMNLGKDGCCLRVGEVTSVDPARVCVRVTFDDEESLTSDWLQVLQMNTYQNKDYCLPDIGEDVVCLFFERAMETGFVIGSFFAGEVEPPQNSVNVREVKFSDGTVVLYDRQAHTFKLQLEGTIITATRSKVQIEAPNEVIVQGGQKVKVIGGSSVDVQASSIINMTAPTLVLSMSGTTMTLNGSSATITSDSLTFTGPVTFSSNVSFNGEVHIKGNLVVDGTVTASNI